MGTLLGSDYERYARVLQWFVEERGESAVASDAPVARWIDSLRSIAEGAPTRDVPHAATLAQGHVGSGLTMAALCDLYAACAAAHAIQILEGSNASGTVTLSIEPNFAASELGGSDKPDRQVPEMPGGIGTLLAAADIAWRINAGKLFVFGSDSAGLDVEWRDGAGGIIRVEAKGRAFARAFASSASVFDVVRWASGQIRDGGGDLRRRCDRDGRDALRVVRLTAFLPATLARQVHGRAFLDAFASQLARTDRDHVPHAVVAHWFGIDAEELAEGLGSVADSLPHAVDVPNASPAAPRAAINAFYRMVDYPLYRSRKLPSAESTREWTEQILRALRASTFGPTE